MTTVRVYSNVLLARQAVDYLLAHGVIAATVGPLDPLGGFSGVPVAVDNADLTETARALLHEFESTSPVLDTRWEEQTVPDLSRLPEALGAPCPRCAAGLPLDVRLARCPACGAPVDVVAILFEHHGPDALADCFCDDRPLVPEEILDTAPLRCRACHYSLLGLARRGLCPECGGPYSKDDLLRGP